MGSILYISDSLDYIIIIVGLALFQTISYAIIDIIIEKLGTTSGVTEDALETLISDEENIHSDQDSVVIHLTQPGHSRWVH